MSDLNKKISIQKISDSPSINTEDYVAIEEPLEIQICSPKRISLQQKASQSQ